MQLPSSKPEIITSLLDQLVDAIQPLALSERTADNAADHPAEVVGSLQQLREIILADREKNRLSSSEVSEIGEYSMQLLGNTSRILQRLNSIELQQTNGLLAVSMALWVGANGGQVNELEPLVDTLAWLANNLEEHELLAKLADVLGKLMRSCSLALSSDLDNTNPGRPWRVLNINRGIVATRSHDPELMREAFDTLIANLPQDAAGFFQQGMSEMDRLNYPDHVREVMQEYADRYSSGKVLH